MDCYMPIMNGFDSAKKIKELINKKIVEDIPILALTANASIKDLEQCKMSGMDCYLTKPVSRKQMKEKLEEIFKINILDKK